MRVVLELPRGAATAKNWLRSASLTMVWWKPGLFNLKWVGKYALPHNMGFLFISVCRSNTSCCCSSIIKSWGVGRLLWAEGHKPQEAHLVSPQSIFTKFLPTLYGTWLTLSFLHILSYFSEIHILKFCLIKISHNKFWVEVVTRRHISIWMYSNE